MDIKKIDENVRPPTDGTVTLKKMGHIAEVRYMVRQTVGGAIKKLNKNQYMLTQGECAGEVLEFKHSESRIENIGNVSCSLRKLRDLINANVVDTSCCLWCTLTYKENMQDTKRLYEDFRKFNMRWQSHLKKNGFPKSEYISAAEPQGRGAWHLHIIFIFPEKAPFIENATLFKIWGQGFVSISSLKDIDNVGAYLTAYLSNIDVSQSLEEFSSENNKIFDKNDKRYKKAIIKGARLRMYPTGFQIYRHSRGIKKPEVYETTEAQAMEELKGSALTYEKTIQLEGENGIVNQINYRHYNDLRKEKECYQEKNLGLEGQ